MNGSGTIDEDKLATVIENVCQQGCKRVETIIELLQNGNIPDMASGLNEGEITKLLTELTEVMRPLKHDE